MNTIILRRRKLGKTSTEAIKAFSKQNINVIRNDKPIPTNVDFVIRWGCTSNVETNNVLNTAKAIHSITNKIEFRRLLENHTVKYAPKTWFSINDWLKEATSYPTIIVRPEQHAQGRHLLKFTLEQYNNGSQELNNFIAKHPSYYISEYINKIAEYRVFIVQGRAVWVAQKTPSNPEAIAWNVAQGGRFDNVRWNDWPLKTVKTAIAAFNLTELDFGGVDLMVDKNNNVYVLEINSAPSQTSPYRQECTAKAFDYVIEYGKKRIPLIEEKGGYLKFIHPAICDKALLI